MAAHKLNDSKIATELTKCRGSQLLFDGEQELGGSRCLAHVSLSKYIHILRIQLSD